MHDLLREAASRICLGKGYHYVGIKAGSEKKYRLLSEIQRNGHPIEFDVLYDAKAKGAAAIKEEIGRKEGEYIR